MKLNKINPVLNEITKQIENSLSESLKQGFYSRDYINCCRSGHNASKYSTGEIHN